MLRHSRSLSIVTVLIILAVQTVSGEVACSDKNPDLSPVHFEGDKLWKAVQMLDAVGKPPFPMLGGDVSFTDPVWRPDWEKVATKMRISLHFDAQTIGDSWSQTVKDNIRARDDNCTENKAEKVAWRIQAPELIGTFEIFMTKWVVCSDWTGKNFPSTNKIGDAWQKMRPVWQGDSLTLGVSGHSSFEDLSPVLKDLLTFLANIASLSPSLHFLFHLDSDIFAGLDGMQQAAEEIRRFTVNQGAYLPVSANAMEIESAGFEVYNTRPSLWVSIINTDSGAMTPGEACDAKIQLKRAAESAETVTPAGTTHVVVQGDTVWNLARHYYGAPFYYPLIGASNKLSIQRLQRVVPGMRLRIEPIAALRAKPGIVLVHRGESLWSLYTHAEHCNSNGPTRLRFSDVLRANRVWVADPNKIFPVQAINFPQGKRPSSSCLQ